MKLEIIVSCLFIVGIIVLCFALPPCQIKTVLALIAFGFMARIYFLFEEYYDSKG